MIRKIIVKESKEILRDGRFKIALGIVLVLLALAVFIGAKQYQNTQDQYREAENHERNMWLNQGEKNPHSAAHYGTYAFKPKYPLSLIDQGVDKYTGVSIYLEAHKRNEAQFSAASDQTGLSRFGDLTPDFILLFIVPLLIILIGYNSFTKEKENGTFSLLKSQGISGFKLSLGKWLATLLPIAVITALLFVLAAIILSTLKDFGNFHVATLLTLFLVYLLYYMVFTNLVLFVSYKAKNSGISLVVCLTLWIIACFVAPKTASNFADKKYPYPTRQEFATNVLKDKEAGLDGHNPFSKEAKRIEENLLKEHGVDSVEKLPFNFDGYIMQKGEEHEAEVYFKHYKVLKEQFYNQTKTYRTLAAISPFLPVRFLSMSLANTDYETHWSFADAAEKHRVAMQAVLNGDLVENSKTGDWDYLAQPELWEKIPAFSYEPPGLSENLRRNTGNLALLGIWFAITFSILFVVTKKI